MVVLAGDSDDLELANGLLHLEVVLACGLHRIFCGLIVDWRRMEIMLCGKIDGVSLLISPRQALRLVSSSSAVEAGHLRFGIASGARGRSEGLQSGDRRLQGSKTARLGLDLMVGAGLIRLSSSPGLLLCVTGSGPALY